MTTIGPNDPLLGALRKRLRELGYVEGRNIQFEYRGAHGEVKRLPALALELAELMVDVIVASPDPAVLAAKSTITTIPVVMMMFTIDPVAARVVESFGRPGANFTGIYGRQSELVAKRLEVLQEVLPKLSRVAVLYDAIGASDLREVHAAAQALRLEVSEIELKVPYDLRAAFKVARDSKAGAMTTLYSVPIYAQRAQIARMAIEQRLPTIAQFEQFTTAGGLIAYGPNPEALFARSAYFVDRILKGVKPSELPVEQVGAFELSVNLRTAKAIGVTIPQSILVRADRVIR